MSEITWQLIEVDASEIKPNPANPKIRNEAGMRRLKKSFEKFGKIFDGICNKDLSLIDGHSRLEINPNGKAMVFVPSQQLTKENENELNAIFDLARAGEPDLLMIEETFGDEFMEEWELKETEAELKKKLLDRFLVPPFSVLDTRQDYWQSRKRWWLNLGIRSEVGRGGRLLMVKGDRDISKLDDVSLKILGLRK